VELKTIRCAVADGVATVWLDRPHRRNAWTGRMHAEYRHVMAELDADSAVRCAVVTGTGDSFCVGADSDALAKHADRGGYDPGLPPEPAQPGYGVRTEWDHDFAWHFGLRLPVLARVNGACAGVGLVLACYCDLRVAVDNAKLTAATPQLGLPAELGLSWLLSRLIGATNAADLLLTGRIVTARDPMVSGLFNRVVSNDELDAAVDAYTGRFAHDVSPLAVTTAKRQLWGDLMERDVGASVERSKVLLDDLMATPDYREGVAALREKRPPHF
jgi:enoyl-CoA hydratase/carnithine racemase